PRQVLRQADARETLKWGLILGAVMLASGIVAAYLISRAVSKPIAALILGADRIRSGELDARVRIASRDELGQLAYAFNRMARRLNESITALEDLNHDLEAEVARRTAEVQRAARFSALLNAPLGHHEGTAAAGGTAAGGAALADGPDSSLLPLLDEA